MKRRLVSLALSLGLTVGVVPNANAETLTFPCGGTATYSVLMPTGVAFDGKQCSGSLTIDSSVKILDAGAFTNSTLTSAIIPNSVTRIGDAAFYGTPLTSVTIGNSVISIGAKALMGTRLTSVIIPNSVTDIGEEAFRVGTLTSVTIGNSVTKIGDRAFIATKLTSVTIPNSVTSIGTGAFGLAPLTSVTIGTSVTSIGINAFTDTLLTSVTIPNSVVSIGIGAFSNIPLTSVTIGNSVTRIGDAAFYGTKLTSVVIPNSVISIGPNAFRDTRLTSVIIPNSVTDIGCQVFAGILTLTTISIPDNLEPRCATTEDNFERNYSLTRIEYCGKFASFPVTPTCPPERQALIDAAKAGAAAADKVTANKAAAESNRKEQVIKVSALPSQTVPLSSIGIPLKVTSTSNLSVFAYNSTNSVCVFENAMIRTKTSGRCVIGFSQEGNSEFKPANNVILDFTVASAAGKKTTISCIKGKVTKKVTAVSPNCPAGYKKK